MSCTNCNHLEDGACTRIYIDEGIMVLWDDPRVCSLDIFTPKSDFHCKFYEGTEPRFWHAGGLGFQEPLESKPTMWEYLICGPPFNPRETYLDLLTAKGEEGWELVSIVPGRTVRWHDIVFKRRKE